VASEHTLRTATFDVLRRLELTTIFSNPGSTEVPFLAGLPDDLRFALAPRPRWRPTDRAR
jgi:benzoylformate decarboxylase